MSAIATDRTPLESRAETFSLEALQQRRRDLLDANGRLIALYGSFGHADDFRKQRAELLKVKYRMALTAGRAKPPSVDEVEAAAYGSDEYAQHLDTALAEKIEYLRVQSELDDIAEQIRSREIELLAYNSELKLSR